ncbi:DUF443 family protein [Virgibacillus natechei]
MNCEVQHLTENIRYRILIIDGEHYILDMEQSFWKIIFPFLFWVLPSPVFKVENQSIMEQLKGPKTEKKSGSLLVFLGVIAFLLGNLLTPLMDYFEIQSSPLVNILLVIVALILVALLYFSISHKRKKKLYNDVQLETLQQHVLWIRPRSTKQIFKLLAFLIWFFGFVSLGFAAYILTGNIMVLIIASGLLFALLLANRITVEGGRTKVKFKGNKNAAS